MRNSKLHIGYEKGANIAPFSSTNATTTNYSQVMSDRGSGIVSQGMESLYVLSLLYKGKGRTGVGLFNNSKPPTTVPIFDTLSMDDRVTVVLGAIHMDNNMNSYYNKKSPKYLTLIAVVKNMIRDIMRGEFIINDYKYSLLNLCKTIVRGLHHRNISYEGIVT